MTEMKTIKFPGDTEPREIVDAAARERISAIETAQDWIEIVNTTLEEDVLFFETSADVNGNPFVCKTLLAQLIFAEQPSGNFYFGSQPQSTYWTGANMATNLPQNTANPNTELLVELTVVEGLFVRGSFGSRPNTNKSFGHYLTTNTPRPDILVSDPGMAQLMKTAFIALNSPTDPKALPAGTIIRIWGVKA